MKEQLIEWGVATLTVGGQTESGDRHLVRTLPDGVLIAVVDGIGHGHEAAHAAAEATGLVERHSADPLEAILARCHESLRETRGVVMSLARYDTAHQTLTWIGVGNVEGLLIRRDPEEGGQREWLLLRRGVLGSRLPALQTSSRTVKEGDLLILLTDGVDVRFDETLDGMARPQLLADRILARHAKTTDDATVLVTRFAGRRR